MNSGNAAHRIEQGPSHEALASLSLSTLLAALGTSVANVALPTLTQAFAVTFSQVQWVVIAYLLSSTTLVVSVGRLGDIAGRRRLLLTGIALFTFASLGCGIAPSLPLLIAARVVQGIGAAFMLALTMAMVNETVSKARAGSAIGLLGTMAAIGTALGPAVGGLLIATFSWRALFLINVPLSALAFVLAYRSLPADPARGRATPATFDSIGTLLLATALASYALAMTIGRGHFGRFNIALLVFALIVAGLFVFAESRIESPLLRPSLFRDDQLRTGLITLAIITTVMMATLVVGPFYLSHTLQLNAAMVGFTMSVGPIVAALASVPAGRLTDRFGSRRVSVAGLCGATIGAIALALIPASVGVPGYVVPLSLMTASYATFQTSNNTLLMKDVGPDQRGVTSGLLSLARNLGLVSGAAAMGAIFTHASGTTDVSSSSPIAVEAGMHTTFAVAAVLVLVALAFQLRARAHSQ